MPTCFFTLGTRTNTEPETSKREPQRNPPQHGSPTIDQSDYTKDASLVSSSGIKLVDDNLISNCLNNSFINRIESQQSNIMNCIININIIFLKIINIIIIIYIFICIIIILFMI